MSLRLDRIPRIISMPRLRVFSRLYGFRSFSCSLLLLLASPSLCAVECTRLVRVDVETSEILAADRARLLLSDFSGRCIDGTLTRELLAVLSDDLIERGYITSRPYLLAQDISDGQVEIRILVGRIEKVVDGASGRGNRRLASAFLFSGEVLNLRRLEAALEVMQRLPSVEASFEILPGSRPGSSIVSVDSSDKDRLRIEFGANAQTELEDRLSLYVALDNPLDINDQLELRLNDGEVLETYQTDSSEEISYAFALGDYLVGLGRADIEFEQRIQGNSGSFVSEGETVSETVRLDRGFARSQSGRWGFAISLERKDSRNFFDDELIDVSSYVTSQLQLELNHLWLQPWGQLSSQVIFHRGLDAFGARDDDYFERDDGSGSLARLQFEKYTLGGQLRYWLPPPGWSLDLALQLQYSDDILFDNDKLSLGSPYTVRGYASALSGSNAGYLRADILRLLQTAANPFGEGSLAKSITLSAGIDYGEVKCEADNADSCGQIYGAGVAIRVQDANFSGIFSWGHPLEEIGDDIGDRDIYHLDLRWLL